MGLYFITKTKSICGSVLADIDMYEYDWDTDISEVVYCCGNCHTIMEARQSWRNLYKMSDPYARIVKC